MGKLIWNLVKVAYATILRPLLLKAINDDESEVDEIVMGVMDRLFDYGKK